MRNHWAVALVIVTVSLGACDSAKRDAAATLEDARLGVETSRKWGAETFAPKLQTAAERELATAEKSFAQGRYAQVQYPAQRALDAARLARAEASKLPKHSPKTTNNPKTAKGKVKK